MKKLGSILMICVLGLGLRGVGYSAEVTTSLVSEAGVPAHGPVDINLPLDSTE